MEVGCFSMALGVESWLDTETRESCGHRIYRRWPKGSV